MDWVLSAYWKSALNENKLFIYAFILYFFPLHFCSFHRDAYYEKNRVITAICSGVVPYWLRCYTSDSLKRTIVKSVNINCDLFCGSKSTWKSLLEYFNMAFRLHRCKNKRPKTIKRTNQISAKHWTMYCSSLFFDLYLVVFP